jgi:Ca2+-binding EF-hand superfamily protein
MLHHFNKSNLEAYSLENIFSRYDKENASYIEKERFAPLLTNASIFKKPADVT